ncbi:MAG: proline--tRNA ligase [Planctomycetota bacterium]|nr:proline--tRNA ligase [Planctomycetota bacterium]
MRWSRTLIPTLREAPAEAETASHRLLLRAGFIHRIGSGLYGRLPLGASVLQRLEGLARRVFENAGATALRLPILQPLAPLAKTGRDAELDDDLFTLTDRTGRRCALAPGADELVAETMAAHVDSYRLLPLTVYEIGPRFRDEFRPGPGLLGTRERMMATVWSFHTAAEGPGGPDETFARLREAAGRMLDRCGLAFDIVHAPSAPEIEAPSEQLICPSEAGDQIILRSDSADYAANLDACAIGDRRHSFDGDPTGALEVIPTPGCASIEDVCAFFRRELGSALKPQNMLKTLLYEARSRPGDGADASHARRGLIMAVVRGDHDVNETKLARAARSVAPWIGHLELATDDILAGWEHDFPVGYMGPHLAGSFDFTALLVDPDAAQGEWFWVTGANETDHHVRHFNWTRDLLEPHADAVRDRLGVADIRSAREGDPSPTGGVLHAARGISLVKLTRLGSACCDAMGFRVLDEHQQRQPVFMARYELDLDRLVAAVVERHHDEDGIIWPAAIAPFDVLITPVKYEGRNREVADALHEELTAAGLAVLLDDRDQRPGPKFKDGDLIGLPIRLTVGPKGLERDSIEFYRRDRSLEGGELVRIDDVAARCRARG